MTAHPADAVGDQGRRMTGDRGDALSDLVVVDFSRVLAGPLATMVLGDLGADVIKVERPGAGDDTRAWGPPFVADRSTYFDGLNRNKRGVVLDLADQGDRARARWLCATADVVVDNFRPGAMRRWGLDREALARDRPAIITCTITGFGSAGDGAHLAGYDLLVQAMAGWMHITGPAGGEPTKVGVALVDKLAGLYAATGILAAVHHRDRTGEGQHLEVSLMATGLAGLLNVAAGFLGTGREGGRLGNRHPSIAPYQPYDAADGPFVLAVGSPTLWDALCEVIGRADLHEDPRFATNADRVANVDALEGELQAAFATETADTWVARLRARGVPAGRIESVAGAFATAEALGLDPVVTATAGERRYRGVRSPIELSATPTRVRHLPPELGADDALLPATVPRPDHDPTAQTTTEEARHQ